MLLVFSVWSSMGSRSSNDHVWLGKSDATSGGRASRLWLIVHGSLVRKEHRAVIVGHLHVGIRVRGGTSDDLSRAKCVQCLSHRILGDGCSDLVGIDSSDEFAMVSGIFMKLFSESSKAVVEILVTGTQTGHHLWEGFTWHPVTRELSATVWKLTRRKLQGK
jgi:hypothetical protein